MFDWSQLNARPGQVLFCDPGREIQGETVEFRLLKEGFALVVGEEISRTDVAIFTEREFDTELGQLELPTGQLLMLGESSQQLHRVDRGIYRVSVERQSGRVGLKRAGLFELEVSVLVQLATTETSLSGCMKQAGRALRDCIGLPPEDFDHRIGLVRAFDVDGWRAPRKGATAVTRRRHTRLACRGECIGLQFAPSTSDGELFYLWVAHPRCDGLTQCTPTQFLGIQVTVEEGCVVEVSLFLRSPVSDDDAVECMLWVREGFMEDRPFLSTPRRRLVGLLDWRGEVLEVSVPNGEWGTVQVELLDSLGAVLDSVRVHPLWTTSEQCIVYQVWLLEHRAAAEDARIYAGVRYPSAAVRRK